MDVETRKIWLESTISDELKNQKIPEGHEMPTITIKVRGSPQNIFHFYTASLKEWEAVLIRTNVQIPNHFAKLLAESIVDRLNSKDDHFEAVDGFINYFPKEPISKKRRRPVVDPVDTFRVSSIGRIRSVFRSKFACPRQGIVKNSRAVLTLAGSIMSEVTKGLEEYTHVTLIWMFDQHKVESKGTHTFVSPPRLNGKRVGWMSTRTPHRVNNIGLSVVKLDSVNGRDLHLSGVDLVDGTAIIDVKPYIPLIDAFPNASTPMWVKNPHTRLKVNWRSKASDSAKILVENESLDLYGKDEASDVLEAIEEVVSLDPRSQHSKKKHRIGGIHGFLFDNLEVVFTMRGNDLASIVLVETHDKARGLAVNTAEWLDVMKSKIGEWSVGV